MISGMDFRLPPLDCKRITRIFDSAAASKNLQFHVLTERSTNQAQILDQITQELYILGHQGVPFGLGALSTPGGGAKSKEKRRFIKGSLSCG
jgi:hypothetical protein